ncbi:MAG: cysteine desulfurase [Ruminococcaceae bacterium]|nr:cysteine desulfurase [Oscillospiraceae bacterium]
MSIYLDNSATTPICREALDKYNTVSLECFGNPSSLHDMGVLAERELTAARRELLSSLGDKQADVIFTASGTEANNLAIFGRALSKQRYLKGSRIITTDGEHASVHSPLSRLAEMGFEIVKIPTRGGTLDLDALKETLTKNVILVTLMMVNNETGALYDIAAASRLIHTLSPEALLHVDATQSYLKLPFTRKSLGADMITVSSHKIEGPKGVGALVVDAAVKKARGLSPIILGGGQEGAMRSGTENVPGIAAFGEAIRIGFPLVKERAAAMDKLRSRLIEKINTEPALSEISITLPESHAPHILNITLPEIKSETMLHALSASGIYVSSGSACSSNSAHSSSALVAFGRTEAEADCSLRVSLSHRNTPEDIDALCSALADSLTRLVRMKR